MRLTSRVMGERMYTYLVTLRVYHACRLLVRTDQHVMTMAAASGFQRSAAILSAFRTHVGVMTREYLRTFASPRSALRAGAGGPKSPPPPPDLTLCILS